MRAWQKNVNVIFVHASMRPVVQGLKPHTTARNETSTRESSSQCGATKPSNMQGPILSASQIANGDEPGYLLLRSLLIVQEYVLAARRRGNTECTIGARDFETFGVVREHLAPDASTSRLLVALRYQGYFAALRPNTVDRDQLNLFLSWKSHCA